MFLPRSAERRLSSLRKSFPAVVVTGARQVGKSTFLRHAPGDAAGFVVFDPVFDLGDARRDPELSLDNHRTPLVLDEVQYAPELLRSLKRRIDRDRTPGRDVLTGSQLWGVVASVAESLAGRAAFLDLEGFSLVECAATADAGHWLAAWIDLPESVVDTGVTHAISTPNAIPSQPAWGALFEPAVFAEIRKAVSRMSPRPIVHHRRTRAGAKVDLLLERDGTFFPIEIKAASRLSRGDTTGITAFRKTYPKPGWLGASSARRARRCSRSRSTTSPRRGARSSRRQRPSGTPRRSDSPQERSGPYPDPGLVRKRG